MPTGSQSQGRLLTVAAFAVCLNMPEGSYESKLSTRQYESKLSTNLQAYLNAWTHCFAQKKHLRYADAFSMYVTRFELATFWSVARRSIQLSYTYISC